MQRLSVSLPTNTLYVSGTVNDVAVTWTLQENDVWEAIADRAEDDTYHIALTIISSSGQSTNRQFTLYYGLLNLITDRTQADVDYVSQLNILGWENMNAQQRSDYLAGLKGAYNATDMNRVGNAVSYVAQRLTNCGYMVNVNPRLDWQIGDIPTVSDLTAYLDDVRVIRAVLAVSPATPPVPEDMDKLTYIEANNIEQILLDVNLLIDHIAAAWFYSGELYSGEVV